MSTFQAPPNLQAIWDLHHQPRMPAMQQQQQQQPRDVSSLHPVFFTGRLRPAAGAPVAAAVNMLHPVAHGYVYRDERFARRPGGPMFTDVYNYEMKKNLGSKTLTEEAGSKLYLDSVVIHPRTLKPASPDKAGKADNKMKEPVIITPMF
ncbi:hypothetical protein F5B22DRAFT_644647 [Xylaria bambusicola]|uniref:uncharacterized protein n=1 Tax=Xylaria bambusicola TaxID=326684 RepID=UPI002008BAC0|nr:uncharacterized protein F5B22DRAFT_644647 [Xylaria bambusicola]KAI0520907.1 hypothetical protein F5B22DRAFT_644647 [Xylaria bambusicola]